MFPIFFSDDNDMNAPFPCNMEIHDIFTSFPQHRHDFIEFTYVISGRGKEIVNGKAHDMKPGTFSFIMPFQVHEILLEPGGELHFYNCSMSQEAFFEPGDTSLALNEIVFGAGQDFSTFTYMEGEEALRFCSVLKDMQHEFNGNAVWRRLLFRAKLVELLVTFDRYRRNREPAYEAKNKPLRNGNVWKAIHFVYSNHYDNITLKDLSNRFFLSVPYLSALFKQYTGKNFRDFLHEARIHHACGLLSSTDRPVSDIAIEVGYESYVTFFRIFREHKGISPTEYRKSRLDAR